MGKGLPRSLGRAASAIGASGLITMTIPVKDVPISVAGASGVGWGSAVISGLPEGNLVQLGCVAYMQFSTSDADVQAAFDGDYALATTPNVDANLVVGLTTSAPLGAATAKLSPVVRTANAAPLIGTTHDNTAGDLELNLNLIIDDANISGDAVFLANGVVHIAFIKLGDD